MLGFFKGFWAFLAAFTWWQALIILTVVLIALLIYNFPKTKNFWRLLFGKSNSISCGNCILILMGKREQLEEKKAALAREAQEKTVKVNSILKKQMNFTEQKLVEIQSHYLSNYSKTLSEKNADNTDENIKQYRLFYGLLRDGLVLVKDELRRSFKENGFYEIGGNEFANNIKDRALLLTSIYKQHIINLYPSSNMEITLQDVQNETDDYYDKFENIVFEIYVNAKEVFVDSEEKNTKIKNDLADKFIELQDDFQKEIDEFVEDKNK